MRYLKTIPRVYKNQIKGLAKWVIISLFKLVLLCYLYWGFYLYIGLLLFHLFAYCQLLEFICLKARKGSPQKKTTSSNKKKKHQDPKRTTILSYRILRRTSEVASNVGYLRPGHNGRLTKNVKIVGLLPGLTKGRILLRSSRGIYGFNV